MRFPLCAKKSICLDTCLRSAFLIARATCISIFLPKSIKSIFILLQAVTTRSHTFSRTETIFDHSNVPRSQPAFSPRRRAPRLSMFLTTITASLDASSWTNGAKLSRLARAIKLDQRRGGGTTIPMDLRERASLNPGRSRDAKPASHPDEPEEIDSMDCE